MVQTPLFSNIAELSALNVFTFLSSSFTVVSVPFRVIVPKTNQLTCHSFTGDLYVSVPGGGGGRHASRRPVTAVTLV